MPTSLERMNGSGTLKSEDRVPVIQVTLTFTIESAATLSRPGMPETGKSCPLGSLAHVRTGPAQWLAEGVATFGLLLVVLDHRRSEDAPWMVAGWIGAAYWFTASTSFANPAITIARSLSNTFSGIRPADLPAFIGAQFVDAFAALAAARALFPLEKQPRAAFDTLRAVEHTVREKAEALNV